MLSMVVSDALKGVDITEQYAAYYRKMLADTRLSDTFIEALTLLQMDAQGELEPLPFPPKPDLTFLRETAFPPPTIKKTETGGWLVSWRLAPEQWRGRFALVSQTDTHSRDAIWQEIGLTLLHTVTQIDSTALMVVLEALAFSNKPDIFLLYLRIVLDGELPERLQASLEWGEYNEIVAVELHRCCCFSPLSLHNLLDENGQQIRADLCLKLESVPV